MKKLVPGVMALLFTCFLGLYPAIVSIGLWEVIKSILFGTMATLFILVSLSMIFDGLYDISKK